MILYINCILFIYCIYLLYFCYSIYLFIVFICCILFIVYYQWYFIFLIVEIWPPIWRFIDEKFLKNKLFSNPGFLRYTVSISLLAENYHICGTRLGMFYKKRRLWSPSQQPACPTPTVILFTSTVTEQIWQTAAFILLGGTGGMCSSLQLFSSHVCLIKEYPTALSWSSWSVSLPCSIPSSLSMKKAEHPL